MASGVRIGEAFVEVTADTTNAFRSVDRDASSAGSQAGGKFSGAFGKGLAGMGTAIAGAFAVDKVVGFMTGAVQGASDLNEETSKSQVIFGSASGAIATWAQGAAKSVGLSETAALKATGTFGNMFTQIGFGSADAANMSKDVVQLSADLGSFNNLPTADVADMMGAAFRGEYDSIQALLPGINAASVEQKALEMTGKSSAKALTDQEKAAAVLALAHSGGAKASGDFAKTQGGMAGQVKIAQAEFANMSASIGTALLPTITNLMSFVNTDLLPGIKNIGSFIQTDVVPAFQNFANGIQQNLPLITGIATAIGVVLLPAIITSGIQMAITAAAHVAGWISMAAGAVLNAATVVGAWVLMGIQSMLNAARMAAAWLIAMGPIGLVIALVVGLVAIIIANWDTISAVTIAIFTAIGQFLSDTWNNIVAFLSQAWTNIVTFVTDSVNNVSNIISSVFNAISSTISGIWNAIAGFISTVWGNIVGFVSGAVNTVFSVVSSVFSNVWSTVSSIFTGIWGTISGIWNNILGFIGGVVRTIAGTVSGVFYGIWSTIGSIVNGVWNTISGVFYGIWRTIDSVIWGIQGAVRNVFGTLAGIMTGAFNGVSGTIRGVINGVISAINGAIGGINGAIDIANMLPGVNIGHMGYIPGLATGGTIKSSGTALVGEKGPELVTLPKGATVYPNGTGPSSSGTGSKEVNLHIHGNVNSPVDVDMILSKLEFAESRMA